MATVVPTTPGPTIADPAGYCRNMVHTQDYDAFLTAQFYPAQAKPGYLAIRAFYVRVIDISHGVYNLTNA